MVRFDSLWMFFLRTIFIMIYSQIGTAERQQNANDTSHWCLQELDIRTVISINQLINQSINQIQAAKAPCKCIKNHKHTHCKYSIADVRTPATSEGWGSEHRVTFGPGQPVVCGAVCLAIVDVHTSHLPSVTSIPACRFTRLHIPHVDVSPRIGTARVNDRTVWPTFRIHSSFIDSVILSLRPKSSTLLTRRPRLYSNPRLVDRLRVR